MVTISLGFAKLLNPVAYGKMGNMCNLPTSEQ